MASQSSVIGLLRVLLSANVAEYETAMKRSVDVTKKATQDIKTSATEINTVGGKIATSLGVPADTIASVGKLGTALKALGVAGAALTIADLTSDFVAFSGQISDLSERTDISVRELQRLQYAGDLVGVSVEQITAAISQMQNRLAGGDKGAIDALHQLGLEWERLRDLDPGAQFEAIAAEISKIPDPAERTHLAMELFGRSGATLLPLLKQNLKEVGDEGERLGAVIDERLIRSGDRLGDAWTKLKSVGFGLFAETLRPMLDHFDRLPSDINAVSVAIDTLKGKIQELPTVKTSAAVEGLFGGATFDALLKQRKLSADEIKAITADADKAIEATAKKTDQWAESIKRLRDELSGAKLQTDVRRLQEAVNGLTREQRESAIVMDRVAEAAHKLFEQGAILTPQLFQLVIEYDKLGDALPPVIAGLEGLVLPGKIANDHFEKTIEIVDQLIPKLEVLAGAGQAFSGAAAVPLPELPDFKKSTDSVNELIDALHLLGRVAPGEIGFVVDSIASMISAWQMAVEAVRTFGAEGATALDKISAGLTLVGTVIQIGKDLWNLGQMLFGNRGRDIVKDFANLQGGFDALHERLLRLGGAEGERLWIMLTQGVGRNNPQQAAMAVNEVTAALRRWELQAEQTAKTQETETTRMVDTIQREYDRLTSEIDRLTQSIADEAPEEVMGVVERQTRERIALIEEERRKVGEALEDATAAIAEDAQSVGQTVDEHIGGAIEGIGDDLNRNVGEWEDWSRRIGSIVGGVVVSVPIPEPPDGAPGFASGTPGLDYGSFSPSGSPAWMHSKEAVIPQTRVGEFAGQVATGLSRVMGSGSGDIWSGGGLKSETILEVDKRVLARVIADVLPGELRRLGVRVVAG